MMGTHDILKTALGDIPDGADIVEYNTLAAKALIRLGLAVVLCHPQDKHPICILTTIQKKQADRQAQAEAQAAGNPRWDKVAHRCGAQSHHITELKDLNRTPVRAALASGANLAVYLPGCTTRVVIVDVDTAEQRAGFLADWSEAEGETVDVPMTVTSPGLVNVTLDGEEIWAHKDGGHFWFTLPEGVELPEKPGKFAGPSGWVADYNSGYVLVPPSVRKEGHYRLTGAVMEAPEWLVEAIQESGEHHAKLQEKRRERAAQRLSDGPDDIDTWAAETSWDELLTGAGWTATGSFDSCGCPTWTRPGNPAHLKSATAHEVGCAVYDTSLGHGPLHSWSDAVEFSGSRTASKLTFLAHAQYDGDIAAAITNGIGLEPRSFRPDDATVLDDLAEFAMPAREASSPPQKAPDQLGEVGEVDPKVC